MVVSNMVDKQLCFHVALAHHIHTFVPLVYICWMLKVTWEDMAIYIMRKFLFPCLYCHNQEIIFAFV